MKWQTELITPSGIEWHETTPWSARFGDIYFSSDGGHSESRHVFLEGNRIAERWNKAGINTFVIGETGFGTGLNFLISWSEWQKRPTDNSELIFISSEKFPLGADDIVRLHQDSALAPLATQLASQYPLLLPGFHTIRFEKTRTTLMLLLGDSEQMFSRLQAKVDAWYLDGFSPAKNPEMWQEGLIKQISRLSRAGTTLASFTAAGHVRRLLASHGFDVRKEPGFGRKRDMTTAVFKNMTDDSACITPWFLPAPKTGPALKRIAIIGAGIAGCTSAWRLAQHHHEITILEASPDIAQGASGNPAGIVRPKAAHLAHAPDSFAAAAWSHAIANLRRPEFVSIWNASGVHDDDPEMANTIHNAPPESWLHHLTEIQPKHIAENESAKDWIHYRHAGWLSPRALCQSLVKESGATLITNCRISQINRTANGWQLLNENCTEILEADIVILATGHSPELRQTFGDWPIVPVAGQVTFTDNTPHTLESVFCEQGYVTPTGDCQVVFGATYHSGQRHPEVSEADHQENLGYLRALSPVLASRFEALGKPLHGRVSVRGQTPDYQPIVGAIPDDAWARAAYAGLAQGKRGPYPPMQYKPGLYINAGHGSRGLVNAFLSAEIIACEIHALPMPAPTKVIESVSPARFLMRSIRKQTRVTIPRKR